MSEGKYKVTTNVTCSIETKEKLEEFLKNNIGKQYQIVDIAILKYIKEVTNEGRK